MTLGKVFEDCGRCRSRRQGPWQPEELRFGGNPLTPNRFAATISGYSRSSRGGRAVRDDVIMWPSPKLWLREAHKDVHTALRIFSSLSRTAGSVLKVFEGLLPIDAAALAGGSGNSRGGQVFGQWLASW
jgi:hypothetical protein